MIDDRLQSVKDMLDHSEVVTWLDMIGDRSYFSPTSNASKPRRNPFECSGAVRVEGISYDEELKEFVLDCGS